MLWEEIKLRWNDMITISCKYQTKSMNWLKKSENSICNKIFVINLLIDIDNHSLNIKDVINTIDETEGLTDPVLDFSKTFQRIVNYDTKCLVSVKPLMSERYVRILKLTSFIHRYLTNVALDNGSQLNVVEKYFKEPFNDINLDLPNWSGGNDICWVTPYNQFRHVKIVRDDLALFINEALGLGYEATRLVAIVYPKNYDLPVFKPTTLDACGGENVTFRPIRFVSSSDKGWGLTENTSGSKENMPERIHRKIDSFSGKFKAFYLGKCDVPKDDRDMVLLNACERVLV